MFYFRLLMIFIYDLFVCAFCDALCLIRWGDTNLNHVFGRLIAWGTLKIAGIRLEVDGLENIESSQPCVYVANHQSGMDVATFGAIFPRNGVGVGKKEVKWVPFFGLMFAGAGNVLIDRKRRAQAIVGLSAAARLIRERKVSIWLFPEGTRNRTSAPLLPFKKGAFYMALQAGVPIVPIVSARLDPLFDFRKKRMRGGILRMRVLPAIDVNAYTPETIEQLVQFVWEKMHEAILGLSGPQADPRSFRP